MFYLLVLLAFASDNIMFTGLGANGDYIKQFPPESQRAVYILLESFGNSIKIRTIRNFPKCSAEELMKLYDCFFDGQATQKEPRELTLDLPETSEMKRFFLKLTGQNNSENDVNRLPANQSNSQA